MTLPSLPGSVLRMIDLAEAQPRSADLTLPRLRGPRPPAQTEALAEAPAVVDERFAVPQILGEEA